jgi:transcriptional regulator with GAF, ATPase, and Fis domain
LFATPCERPGSEPPGDHAERADREQSEREFLIGPSRQIRDIVDLVQRVAKLSATVLILGESGTGKELLARLLHKESGRGDAPFIAVNMSAIRTSSSRARSSATSAARSPARSSSSWASSSWPPAARCSSTRSAICASILQAKLLRAIQEGEIERVGGTKPIKTDFRLIAATNIDLERAVKEGRFREDLYYRINVIPIRMPPLRDRYRGSAGLARSFRSATRRSSEAGGAGYLRDRR